jgi:hypothetical protein
VDGYAVYEVLARDGPDFALAHCWAHTKRKFAANATDWPTACGEIDELIGDLYAVECPPGHHGAGRGFTLDTAGWHGDNPRSMNLLRVTGKADVVALTPELSVVSTFALVVGVLLLTVGLLLGSPPAAG